jgi:hypothetical protein
MVLLYYEETLPPPVFYQWISAHCCFPPGGLLLLLLYSHTGAIHELGVAVLARDHQISLNGICLDTTFSETFCGLTDEEEGPTQLRIHTGRQEEEGPTHLRIHTGRQEEEGPTHLRSHTGRQEELGHHDLPFHWFSGPLKQGNLAAHFLTGGSGQTCPSLVFILSGFLLKD